MKYTLHVVALFATVSLLLCTHAGLPATNFGDGMPHGWLTVLLAIVTTALGVWGFVTGKMSRGVAIATAVLFCFLAMKTHGEMVGLWGVSQAATIGLIATLVNISKPYGGMDEPR